MSGGAGVPLEARDRLPRGVRAVSGRARAPARRVVPGRVCRVAVRLLAVRSPRRCRALRAGAAGAAGWRRGRRSLLFLVLTFLMVKRGKCRPGRQAVTNRSGWRAMSRRAISMAAARPAVLAPCPAPMLPRIISRSAVQLIRAGSAPIAAATAAPAIRSAWWAATVAAAMR